MASLRLFIKIAVPAVSVKRSRQDGLWLFSKRRMQASFSLRDKRKFPFGILWKTAKAAHSPKAGLWTTLSAAVCPQNPQALLAKPLRIGIRKTAQSRKSGAINTGANRATAQHHRKRTLPSGYQ